MESVLEQIWDTATAAGSGVLRGFERAVTSLFGSANARYLKRLHPTVAAINSLEPKYQVLSDAELKEQSAKLRARLRAGEGMHELLVDAFAVCRESGRRFLNMRHFDVQLLGGMILHEGKIAEMVTGEGKTLVATLPAYLNALAGKGVHIVTVNDYLARRDMEWMGPLYVNLGLSVGTIQNGMRAAERQESYRCDITYGTNNEFGFDYLRDNMRIAAQGDDRYPRNEQQVQRGLNYAIIDEVDNILIDEARTPLIISGPAEDDVTKYAKADKIARQLHKDVHFEVKEKEHTAHLNDLGVREAEKLAGVESFYTAGNMQWPHLIDNALKAHHLYKRDVNYVVQLGEVVIVDEFTGRLMPGRHWSDGLHQAVEAKEGVRIKEENQTLATITLQNYFKLYQKLAGMTGTAMTEASEFWKIYKLDVVAVPTNKPLHRDSYPDVIYRTEREKFEAIAEEIERIHRWDTLQLDDGTTQLGKVQGETEDGIKFQPSEKKSTETIPLSKLAHVERCGRPILVGTVSIEKSERLSGMLERRGISHQVLNAKHHRREAEIVAQAGRQGAVTIATNMAGRGTDIILGGNAETMAWAQLQESYPTRLDVPREIWDELVREIHQREGMQQEGEEVRKLGGLHVIGTERHEARRIDLQLRGRCGRQGDPGSSRFYLSLEDDLMRIFAGEWVKNVLTRLGMQEGEAIESRMVSRRIEGAQKKVEERNFEIRKNLLEYDEVMDEQRKRVYSYRQRILDGANCRDLIGDMIRQQIDEQLHTYLASHYGAESFAAEAGRRLGVQLEPRNFHGAAFEEAERTARDEADRMAASQVFDAIEENLPNEEDPDEWNWEALAKLANTRWHTNYRDRDLKKIGRSELAEVLIHEAHQAVAQVELSDCARLLQSDYGLNVACDWLRTKFHIELDPQEVSRLETAELLALAHEKAVEAYDAREAEYPVMAGLYHFTTRDASGQKRYDREQLVNWARERFDVDLDLDDLRHKQRDEIRELLIEHSRANNERARTALAEAETYLKRLHEPATGKDGAPRRDREALESLSDWLRQTTACGVSADELLRLDADALRRRVTGSIEDHFRPEMRRMERLLVLQILDAGWKEHLQAMDHLRSSVGLRGYAQVDPKVEYKREGMRLFDEMWRSVGDYVTNLIFRMEQLDEGFVGSTWVESEAIHENAPSTSEIARQQHAAIEGTQADQKLEPIRNRSDRIGRNDPCPCGSGKKYKRCCMNKASGAVV
jgi:preprotein translocase subunit SecA